MATATLNRTSRHTGNGTNGNGHSGRGNGTGNGNGHRNGNGNGKSAANGKPSGNGKRCAADIQLLAGEWEAAKTSAKYYYTEADRIEAELIATLGVGGSLVMKDGRTIRVKDNFRDASGAPKAKHFALAGVKLAEIDIK